MNKFFLNAISGIAGVILTLVFQYYFLRTDAPQSFTIIQNGIETIITESTYTELVEKNQSLQSDLLYLQSQLTEVNEELSEANKQLDSTNRQLSDAEERLLAQEAERYSEENINKTIQDATSYWNNSNYIQALTLLKNSSINSADIAYLYQQYSDKYCTNILAQADNLISERNYDEAKKILTESKALVASSLALENKITEIDNNLPVKLSNFKISSSRFFELVQDKVVEDTVSNRYTMGNLFLISAEGESGYGYGTFYLGKKYVGISGVISVSDESENRSDTQLEGWIEIYSKTNDEYTCLYTSPILSRMTSPEETPELDLTDADWLEIRYYNNGEYYSLAMGYHSLEVILSDFYLYSF